MYVTKVIPITKIPLPSPQILSYFTSKKLRWGSLVLVPLKEKGSLAVVISQKRVEEIKMEIKKSEFKLRPILKLIEERGVLLPYQIELAYWISDYYWAPLGKTLSLFLSKLLSKKRVRERDKRWLFSSENQQVIKDRNNFSSKLYIAPFGFLPREVIKETLQNKGAVLLLIPEKSQGNFWIKEVQKITKNLKIKNNDICFFSTDLPFKKYIERLKKIREDKVKIIVGTRSALFAPFVNLGLILMVEPENKSYKSEMEPRYHAKNVAEKLAKTLGACIVLISPAPSIENYYKAREGTVEREENFQDIKREVIDMRRISRTETDNTLFRKSSLSPLLFEEIQKNLSLKGKTIIFINRRGEGLSIICRDCGWIKKCKNCDFPLSLYKNPDKSLSLVCSYCGYVDRPEKQCEKCQSWNLAILGIGIEAIEEEIKEKFQKAKILRLDSKLAPSSATQKIILKEFFERDGDILITTSILFRHLPIFIQKKVPVVGVVSIDSLLALPDFRVEEEGVKIVYNLLSIASNKFIFQTFFPHSQVVNFIRHGYKSFSKEALKERERFSYPPFSRIIKLTFLHKSSVKSRERVVKLKELLEREVKNKSLPIQVLGPSVSFIKKVRGKYRWGIVLKFKKLKVSEKKRVLSLVPPQWKVDVDPIIII